ncbi:MAG: Jag N-terminal domain-containing protein [Anaerolineae bacterium]|jgi:spoIIIJ-associated protein|nr:Jag N-terminal domain-containing protein [Anaerolineae bacterium]
MNPNEPLEFTGETVDAAVTAGLAKLGLQHSDLLTVEILEEPARGIFGIGARPAKVRLILRPQMPPPPQPTPPPPQKPKPENKVQARPPKPANAPKPSPKGGQKPIQNQKKGQDFDFEDDDEFIIAEEGNYEADTPGEDGEVGKEVLSELLRLMGIEHHITVKRAQANREGENPPYLLDITGPDMSLLIGRRGETLSSLQYVTRLITSRKLQRRANIIVDAGAYKSKRSERLQQLAIRMADQAVETQRTVQLEPMPANERRIIHMTLRSRPDVETRSHGEGEARKVTIVPVLNK